MDDYMKNWCERMDILIRMAQEMHEDNLRLIEESQEVIDTYNMPIELSRPEARLLILEEDDE